MPGRSRPGPSGRMIISRTNRRACSVVRAAGAGPGCRMHVAGCAFCMSWLASGQAGCPGFRPGVIVVGVSRSVVGGRVLPRIADALAAVAGDAPPAGRGVSRRGHRPAPGREGELGGVLRRGRPGAVHRGAVRAAAVVCVPRWQAAADPLPVAGPVSWLLAGLLLAADVAVRAGVTGLEFTPAWSGVVWTIVAFADDGLWFFGMVRLAQVVAEVGQARRQSAELAVARERLQAARALQAAVGERLAGVAAMAAA